MASSLFIPSFKSTLTVSTTLEEPLIVKSTGMDTSVGVGLAEGFGVAVGLSVVVGAAVFKKFEASDCKTSF